MLTKVLLLHRNIPDLILGIFKINNKPKNAII